jgi:hypothetical protein
MGGWPDGWVGAVVGGWAGALLGGQMREEMGKPATHHAETKRQGGAAILEGYRMPSLHGRWSCCVTRGNHRHATVCQATPPRAVRLPQRRRAATFLAPPARLRTGNGAPSMRTREAVVLVLADV